MFRATNRIKMRVMLRQVLKSGIAFLLASGVWLALSLYLEWSTLTTLTMIGAFAIGSIANLVSNYPIEFRIEAARSLGECAGRMGRPPDFYEKTENNYDVADQLAIMQGWDTGNKEFNKLTREERGMLIELNKRNGF